MQNTIKQLFDKYEIEYTQTQIEKLVLFYNNVIEKNKVMNLTNITEKSDFAIKNILDSILPNLMIEKNASVVDIGAGAGFPSIPLKIMRDDLCITMVDSLNKRINFLKEQIEVLGLKNATAVHSRAEDFCNTNREKFDYVVARAVAKLNTLCEYAFPMLKVGGNFIAYKSVKAGEEIDEANNALKELAGKIIDIQKVFIEEIESERQNVKIQKTKPTNKKYPRGKNLPKLKPL